ncbi:MAG: NAD(P)/FAD-dependent oxidoreductase [Alphaproteobacteria bacterium]|jgi:sulfide:quinone oxidoreductase|nr:NAD(P)/FAD-dependent oxidoreductase [Alphaproteobacteria bacterium]MBU0802394.1 NAD(P)/FAD-dependent oxidoreductase [Alphaproteobacteria bacterium]MBU0870164.1 NAD(P)/FAD-dependent oxidoreductase [Alphaproteobacteria bacterium]MBU1399893.1 NAD(P)/FAD-dependent oxidoreductase [Alphaproteobacteria bacterium]MBU1590279.1 NAD(P)/FAD-dependent oxidoreductase [Alphaproteobacteria bacterium]
MADVVVLGAGLGGTIMAYELREKLGRQHRVSVVNNGDRYSFVPSNPWVAVGWREREAIEVDLTKVFEKRGIELHAQGAKRVMPKERSIELNDGKTIGYDYLVIATGPELAFDEIKGFGPEHHTHSVCHVDHAVDAKQAFDRLVANPGPVVIGAVQGASCFGPAYEFAFILDKALRDAKVRDKVPMTFVTSEPYVGHLGLDGVGDTKGLLESELRQHHIKWICNARVDAVEADKMTVSEIAEDGSVKTVHDVPQVFSMMLPAFRGVAAVHGIEGLTNPRGFILVDKHQRNPTFPEVFGVGVCVAIPPVGKTPVPVGVPKTGFMIESMVTATAHNIDKLISGGQPDAEGTWNAVCLADFGDSGIAFVAQPQIPPRNVNWSSSGKWVHAAKIGFEKYFLHKIRAGKSEPFYERLAMQVLGIDKLKAVRISDKAEPAE